MGYEHGREGRGVKRGGGEEGRGVYYGTERAREVIKEEGERR